MVIKFILFYIRTRNQIGIIPKTQTTTTKHKINREKRDGPVLSKVS